MATKRRREVEEPLASDNRYGHPSSETEAALRARGGMTSNRLTPDDRRGAGSPLGYGHEAKREKKERSR